MSTWSSESKTQQGNDFLLLEDSFYILLEVGDKIILEQSVPGEMTWTSSDKTSSTWSNENKTGIDDVLGTEDGNNIGTEDSDIIGLEQSDSSGVTWSSIIKS